MKPGEYAVDAVVYAVLGALFTISWLGFKARRRG